MTDLLARRLGRRRTAKPRCRPRSPRRERVIYHGPRLARNSGNGIDGLQRIPLQPCRSRHADGPFVNRGAVKQSVPALGRVVGAGGPVVDQSDASASRAGARRRSSARSRPAAANSAAGTRRTPCVVVRRARLVAPDGDRAAGGGDRRGPDDARGRAALAGESATRRVAVPARTPRDSRRRSSGGGGDRGRGRSFDPLSPLPKVRENAWCPRIRSRLVGVPVSADTKPGHSVTSLTDF